MSTDFVAFTEIAGDEVSAEQIERIARRYYWAAGYCAGKDVLEAACGTGQGLGLLSRTARSLVAGDYSSAILAIARRHYGDRFELKQFDAQQMPFADSSFDVVILFEALYYVPDVTRFFRECRRVLRPGGHLLIATANKDLYDFTPSAHSQRYLGVGELHAELSELGFDVRCFGDTPVTKVSRRQRMLRPAKMVASRLGLIPETTQAKKLLKRLVFGRLRQMPAEIDERTAPHVPPAPLVASQPDKAHKVILCAARWSGAADI
jgi:ubiquinone/menaquinone biosynthesis C-methylase UbiE